MQKGGSLTAARDIAVFIRATNDMDHIVPVVHKYMERFPQAKIHVVIADYLAEHFGDFRIRHLKKKGAEVSHVIDAMEWHPRLRQLYFRCAKSGFMPLTYAARVLLKFHQDRKIQTSWFAQKFFADACHKNLAAVLVDHNGDLYNAVAEEARKRRVATLSLPHAADNFDNYMIAAKHLDPYKIKPKGKRYPFDRIIAASRHMKDHMLEVGVGTDEQIKILGSPRFCAEWQGILPTIAPDGLKLPETKDFKIVFMLPKKDKNAFESEVLRMIETASRIKNVQIAVKLHTRAERFGRVRASNVHFYGSEVQSKTMIDWADLTIFTATSVVVDNIRQDKPVLHLRRTMGNKITFERYIKSWSIDCRDELCETILRLQSGAQSRTYTPDEREGLIKALIEPAGADVLSLYVDEIAATSDAVRSLPLP